MQPQLLPLKNRSLGIRDGVENRFCDGKSRIVQNGIRTTFSTLVCEKERQARLRCGVYNANGIWWYSHRTHYFFCSMRSKDRSQILSQRLLQKAKRELILELLETSIPESIALREILDFRICRENNVLLRNQDQSAFFRRVLIACPINFWIGGCKKHSLNQISDVFRSCEGQKSQNVRSH